MSSIESQLLEYRAQRARERKILNTRSDSNSGTSSGSSHSRNQRSSNIMGFLDYFRQDPTPNIPGKRSLIPGQYEDEDVESVVNRNDDDKLLSNNCIIACSSQSPATQRILAIIPIFLKVALWTVLWGLFIEIGFGAVYFVISLLIIMYFSMRTRARNTGEMSAYSVFNPGVEKIDGTFTAEQFENELRYGAVHGL